MDQKPTYLTTFSNIKSLHTKIFKMESLHTKKFEMRSQLILGGLLWALKTAEEIVNPHFVMQEKTQEYEKIGLRKF